MRPSVISVSIAMLGPVPSATFALGVAYFEAYELDAARQVLESVANNPETRSGAQLYLGRVALFSSNQPDAAASHFLQAIQVNPKLPDAHAGAGPDQNAAGRLRFGAKGSCRCACGQSGPLSQQSEVADAVPSAPGTQGPPVRSGAWTNCARGAKRKNVCFYDRWTFGRFNRVKQ